MALNQRLSRHLQPQNSGVVSTVRSTLDAYIPVAQERYNNALSIDGRPVLYYQRKHHGIKCTCLSDGSAQPQIPSSPTGKSMEALTPQDYGSDDYVQSLLHSATVRIDRYGARPVPFEQEDTPNPTRGAQIPLVQSRSTINKSTDLDDPFAEEIYPQDPDTLFFNGELPGANVGNTQGCAVCLGTGWVGGYNLLNGIRLVYDAQFQGWSGIVGNAATKPNTFSPSSSAVEIQVLLPKLTKSLDAMRLFSNKEQIVDVKFSLKLPSGAYVSLESNPHSIINYCNGTFHTLRVEFGSSKPTTQVTITHLEMQFAVESEPLYVEWNRVTETENLAVLDSFDPISAVATPLIPVVRLYDVVVEPSYNRVWKVTTAMDFWDRERNPNGWEIQLKLCQKYEITNLLPRRPVHHLLAVGSRHSSRHGYSSPTHNVLNYDPSKQAGATSRR